MSEKNIIQVVEEDENYMIHQVFEVLPDGTKIFIKQETVEKKDQDE